MNNKNRDEREQERRNTVKLNFSFDFLLIKDDKKTSTFLSIQLGLFLLCFGYSNQVSSKVYVCKLSVEEQQQQPRASMNNSDEFHYTTKIDNQISWRWCWLRDHVRFYFRLARKFKTFYQNKTKNHKKMWLCVCVCDTNWDCLCQHRRYRFLALCVCGILSRCMILWPNMIRFITSFAISITSCCTYFTSFSPFIY